jgi:hypothetical protein
MRTTRSTRPEHNCTRSRKTTFDCPETRCRDAEQACRSSLSASSDDEIIAQIGSSRVALRLAFGHRRADAVIAGVTAKSSAP